MQRLSKALPAAPRVLVSLLSVLALGSLLPASIQAASSIVDLQVPNLDMTDQDGESGKFLSHFIGDKLVAITFTYTTCTTICPVLDGIFKNVQKRIGGDLGREISLITISIDPATDIPPRLKEHAEKLGAKQGWTFLTGERETVNLVLKGLEVYSPDIYNHPPTVFIVDGRRGIWSRLYGFPSPGLIEKSLNAHRAGRNES